MEKERNEKKKKISRVNKTSDEKLTPLSVVSNVSNVTSNKKDIKDINDNRHDPSRVLGNKKDIKDNRHDLSEVLNSGILDKLINFIYKNSPNSYKILSDKLKIDYNTIIKTMSRDKQYFKETEKQGKIKFFKLSLLGEKFVKDKINQHNKTINYLKKLKEKETIFRRGVEELMIEAKSFFETYKKQIGEEVRNEKKAIYIDFNDLALHSPILTESLMTEKVSDIIEILESALEETGLIKNSRIRLKNLPKTCDLSIENIRSKHLNKLMSIEARVVSMSLIRPQAVNAKFECPSCGTVISVLQIDKKFREPTRCSCGRKGQFRLISKTTIDSAKIILEDLQEKTDNPHAQRIDAFIKEDLTSRENIKIFTPGNEIKCVGILKEIPIPLKSGSISTRFDHGLEVLGGELFEPEIDVKNFLEKDVLKIKELAHKINTNGLREINSSFAPEIIGENQIKNALILQLCCKRNNPSNPIRNKPNILLIGDPGTAKSILCKFSTKINPQSRECSGGGSSAVGITASLQKEEESIGGYLVVPGALILAKDLLFIDELNNLSDEDKPKLQEGMSEQIIRINKAGQHLTLKVTAGILATANPRYGSFKKHSTYISQFNLPEPIINRFDLIFILHDLHNKDKDEMIASQMITREKGNIETKYSEEFLKKFFIYIRNFEEPKFSGDSEQRIKQVYLKIRQTANEDIVINPRALECLIRLVKASAKCRLSIYIEEKDIVVALKILSNSHFQTSEYSQFNFQEELKLGAKL